MKLHLGCGRRRFPKPWINIDARRVLDHPDPRCLCDPDVIDDVTKLDKFDNNSASIIYWCHGLEHVKRDDRFNVLRRWHDVLKPGGIIRLSVPDFEAIAKAYVEKIVPFDKLWTSLSGSQRGEGNDWLYDCHFHLYDFDHLKDDLEKCNFVKVARYNRDETDHADIDDYSAAVYPHLAKNGFPLSLNVEAIKPFG